MSTWTQRGTNPRRYFDKAFESNMRRQFKIGLHLILLTMVRKPELLLARWDPVNFEPAAYRVHPAA